VARTDIYTGSAVHCSKYYADDCSAVGYFSLRQRGLCYEELVIFTVSVPYNSLPLDVLVCFPLYFVRSVGDSSLDVSTRTNVVLTVYENMLYYENCNVLKYVLFIGFQFAVEPYS
jgi:hypothetical protein